ncbi:hypothetical protein MIJ3_00088 [Pseudomonas phage vB_PaeM_MIJ3]|nr:hypothetical protein MIJ3_00088 [Pseudomonas phage vB_PaeM_MIJ3]
MVKIQIPILDENKRDMMIWCSENVSPADYYIMSSYDSENYRICITFAFFEESDALMFMLYFSIPDSNIYRH